MCAMGENAIRCEKLIKHYPNGAVGLEDVTFSVPYGKVTGLLGPNGAGKSTTINILTTAIRPTSGRFWVCGLNGLTQREEVRETLGLVTQDFAVDWALTVRQHLTIFASLVGTNGGAVRAEVDRWLEVFDLTDKADVRILQLSGGQGRRVQLIRCLMADPPILFVDEPTLGLDPKGVDVVLDSLRNLARQGKCVIMASNAMEQVESGCDEVIFLQNGRLVDQGPVEHFLDTYGGPEFVVALVDATSPPNLDRDMPGRPTVRPQGHDRWAVSFAVRNAQAALPTVITRLAELGVRVCEVQVRPRTLRNIYADLGTHRSVCGREEHDREAVDPS